jgi:hypothetical protein
MVKRPTTAWLAALVLLLAAPAALAQSPPDGTPDDASEAVEEIYRDYRNDGKIDVCDHTREDLQDAVETIDPDFDIDNPDFRIALETGVQRHDDNRCSGDEDEDDATATATATATASPEPTATADDGLLPEPDEGSTDDGSTGDGGALPPVDDGTLPPPDDGTLPEAATPDPALTPVPTVAPATAAVSPTPSPTPAIVATSNGSLLVPGILLVLALLCGLALALFPLAARRNPQVDAAWQEFRFRTRTTWTDFTEWMRLGR